MKSSWQNHLSCEEFSEQYHGKQRLEVLENISWRPQCVVDVGCGGGATSAVLLQRFPGCRVYGIDKNPAAVEAATRVLPMVIQADCEHDDLADCGVPWSEADTVLLLDILEHLYNPWDFLIRLRVMVSDECRIVASIPNMCNINFLHEVAGGEWNYGPYGLLDITHLRFFTEAGMRGLFANAGFFVHSVLDIPQEFDLPSPLYRGPDHVETSQVVVKSADGRLLDDLLVQQKILLASRTSDLTFSPLPRPTPSAGTFALSPLQTLRDSYLDMVMHSVLGLILEDESLCPGTGANLAFDRCARETGTDWPLLAHSMIGLKRMRNARTLAEHVVAEGIPGDLVETGVWRGGTCIMFRAVLKAYNDTTRKVWVADSFAGLPEPSADKYPEDAGDEHHRHQELAISLEQVQANFRKYGLLDSLVVFLKGWFCDTLPQAEVRSISVLRLDGDMYESTINALDNLFPKVSVGGFVIVDDYHYAASCRKAVDSYRERLGITDPIHTIDQFGVYWRNTRQPDATTESTRALEPNTLEFPPPLTAYSPEEGNCGYCPCCRQQVFFYIKGPWLRDQYLCTKCGSIPRQRALSHVLDTRFSAWPDKTLHEMEPMQDFLARRCASYSRSTLRVGAFDQGGEDLQSLSFADSCFDLFVTQDILCLVFSPEEALREVVRVLRPGGAFVFSLARNAKLAQSRGRVRRLPGGELEHLLEPLRFGAPEDDKFLVKWDFGADFEELAGRWSGCPVSTFLVRDRALGLDGAYLEVFVLRKPEAT